MFHRFLVSVYTQVTKEIGDAGPDNVIRLKSFYGTQVSLGSDLWVRLSLTNKLTEEPCCRLN